MKQRTNRERTISTYDNQRIQPIVLERFTNSFDTIGSVEWPTPTSSQNSSAPRKNATNCSGVQRRTPLLHYAIPRVIKPDDFVAITRLGLANYCTNDGIQARAIAAACQNANSHHFSLRLILN
jgi:hypothetical protein